MYKLILFDLGGVLFTDGTSKFISNLNRRYGLDQNLLRETIGTGLGTLYREGRISRNEFWRRVIGALKLEESADDLEDGWIKGYELMEGTRDLIKKLAEKYKIFFMSDNVKEREGKLEEKYGYKKWFNGGVFSYKVGARKPNPLIYNAALKKAGFAPKETIFIDDHESSLVTARQMGMKVLLFKTPEKLEMDLKKLGIL